jgi:hypothetical protein
MPQGCDEALCEDSEGGPATDVAEEACCQNNGQEQIHSGEDLDIAGCGYRGGVLNIERSCSTYCWRWQLNWLLSDDREWQAEYSRCLFSDEGDNGRQMTKMSYSSSFHHLS